MRSALPVVALLLAACSSTSQDKSSSSSMPADSMQPSGTKRDYTLRKVAPSAKYPLKTCVVTGEELGPGRVAYMCDGTEVQFCCGGCANEFSKSPEQYLSKIRGAR
jgi:hypothetical protein